MKPTIIKTNFTAGEVSPKLYGRVDIDKYQNGAKKIRNGQCEIYGGVFRRHGTVYVGTESARPRLVPYVFNQSQSYVLAFTPGTIRVYKSGTRQVLATVTGTVFDAQNIQDLDYVQGADSMFLCDGAHWPQILRRGATESEWSIQTLILSPAPCDEIGHRFNGSLTIETISGQVYRLTSSVSSFLNSDIGRTLNAAGMIFAILTVPSSTQVTATFGGRITSTTVAPYRWNIDDSPLAPIAFTPPGPGNNDLDQLPQVGDAVQIYAMDESKTPKETTADNNDVWLEDVKWNPGVRFVKNTDYTYHTEPIDNPNQSPNIGTWTAKIYVDVESGKEINKLIDKYPNALFTSLKGTIFSVDKTQAGVVTQEPYGVPPDEIFLRASKSDIRSREYLPIVENDDEAVSYNLTKGVHAANNGKTEIHSASYLTKAVFRAQDKGALIRVDGGLFEIVSNNGEASVNAICRKPPKSSIAASGGAWELLKPIWNPEDGYPSSVELYQQRLVFARGNTLSFSELGRYFSFLPGVDDDEAFNPKVASNQMNPVLHLETQRQLIALTAKTEFSIRGGTDTNAVSPTKINIDAQSSKGASKVKPCAVADDLFYMSRARKKLYSLGYDYSSDSMKSLNITKLSENITGAGIVEMGFQNEPNSTLFLVRDDGKIASCALDKDESVVAWSLFETLGNYVSACCVPVADKDEIWVAVNRDEKFHVERFDDGAQTDCGLTQTSDSGQTTWTGFDHLNGKSVDVKADGIYTGRQTIAGGIILLPTAAKKVEAGLPYEMEIQTLTPEIQSEVGSSQRAKMMIKDVTLRVLNSRAATVNGNEIPFRQFSVNENIEVSKLGQAPDLYSGDVVVSNWGWETGRAEVNIKAVAPYEFELLSLAETISINAP